MGFFDLADVADTEKVKKLTIHNCDSCKLYRNCNSPKVGAVRGEGRLGIMVLLGETFLAQEGSKGAKEGSHYNYLRRRFKEVGIDLARDCWTVNAIRCYVADTDKIGAKAMSGCASLLQKDIKRLGPKVIVPVTSLAMEVLLYDRERGRAGGASFYDYCGESIPDQALKTWVNPIYDPSWLEADEKKQADRQTPMYYYEPYFTKQLRQIQETLCKPFPEFEPSSFCQSATNLENALTMLDDVLTWKAWAFDYETNSLSPYSEKSRIHSVAFSNGKVSYAMLWYQDSKAFMSKIRELYTGSANKIAHNAHFEAQWTLVKTGIDIKINHDSMLCQHALHNLKRTGLKVITYIRTGLIGYDSDIEEYLKSSREDQALYGKNSLNRIFEAPVKKVLQYVAMDSLLTYRIMKEMLDELDKEHQYPGYKFLTKLQPVMTSLSHTGFRVDDKKVEEVIPILQAKVDVLYQKVMDNPAIVSKWRGGKFNPSSDHNVRSLVYDYLRMTAVEFTDSGLPSVDEDALMMFKDDLPFLVDIVEYRGAYKLLNTFVLQIKRESINGIIHPNYNIGGVATYRSSSSNPNFQNLPSRNKESVETVKSLLLPLPGHKLGEYDQSGLEFRCSGMISLDEKIRFYISNPDSADMHKATACRLFMLQPDEVTKNLRSTAKTTNFSLLYGSYFVLVAQMTWKQVSSPNATRDFGFDVMGHLKRKGIKDYEAWEAHCQKFEQYFWGEEFMGLGRFRKEIHKEFSKTGYSDYVNGFRYQGPASRNAVCNAVIQGPSASVNFYTLIELHREIKERGMKTRLIGQIHDSIVASIEPSEEELFDYLIWYYGTQKVKEFHPWINIPLAIEKAITPDIDQPWSMKKEVGELAFTIKDI